MWSTFIGVLIGGFIGVWLMNRKGQKLLYWLNDCKWLNRIMNKFFP